MTMPVARRMPPWARMEDILDLGRLAVPVALSRMAAPLMSFTDMIVLGHMAQLELAYVVNGYLLPSIGIAVGMGLLQGVQILTAEMAGRGEEKDTGRIFRRGMAVGTAAGVLFGLFAWLLAKPAYQALGFADDMASRSADVAIILAIGLVGHMLATAASNYLEALRRPGIVVYMMYAGVAVNLALDLALVAGWWGFEPMGAIGVAWASTLSRFLIAAGLVAAVSVLTPGFRRSGPAPAGEFARQNMVGAGSSVSNIAEYGAFNLTYALASLHSLVAGTLYALSIQPIFMSFMFFLGIGAASSVRVAEAGGRRDIRGVANASRLGIAAALLFGGVMAAGVFLLRGQIAPLLVTDGDTPELKLAAQLVPYLALSALILLFDGLQGVASMILRAQDVIWRSAAIHIASYAAIMVPAAWLLGLHLGWGGIGVLWGAALGSIAAGLGQMMLLEWTTARRMSRAPSYEIMSPSGFD